MKTLCPDCGVKPGELHDPGCSVERCPDCGDYKLSCGHQVGRHPDIPWSGDWPGKKECREFGWYCYWQSTKGWIPCESDHQGAIEDLNRLYTDAIWDPEKARFVLPLSYSTRVLEISLPLLQELEA